MNILLPVHYKSAECIVEYNEPDSTPTLRSALAPDALREAMVVRRPVFADPWDSTVDMGAC